MRTFLMLTAVAALGAGLLQATTTTGTTFIPSATVKAAFEQGRPLLETAAYKIHASRRDAAGMVEVHTRDTDIVYVLDGTATLVTGGDVVDGKATAKDEIRGQAIRGGQMQQLSPGDVIVIPNGVPHWFKQVHAPFRYYVVKTTSGGEQ